MTRTIAFLAAAAMSIAPATSFAQVAPGNGQNNGIGYWHLNSGKAAGQPGADCEDLIDEGQGGAPGHAGNAPGGGSPFTGEDSTAGSHYAGSQPQNSRNTASVSQYDVACANQPGF